MNIVEQTKAFFRDKNPAFYEQLRQLTNRTESFEHFPDRVILEKTIIPNLVAKDDIKKVLFVGCDWYTASYYTLFQQEEYWTIDPDPEKAKHATNKHIIDCLENISSHFSKEYFDLIICNGVLGFGINNIEQMEQAFTQCFNCLRDDGILVVGWNDIPSRNIPAFSDCHSLSQFRPFIFPPLLTSQYLTDTSYRHSSKFHSQI